MSTYMQVEHAGVWTREMTKKKNKNKKWRGDDQLMAEMASFIWQTLLRYCK